MLSRQEAVKKLKSCGNRIVHYRYIDGVLLMAVILIFGILFLVSIIPANGI